jgi:hypothetical protein
MILQCKSLKIKAKGPNFEGFIRRKKKSKGREFRMF